MEHGQSFWASLCVCIQPIVQKKIKHKSMTKRENISHDPDHRNPVMCSARESRCSPIQCEIAIQPRQMLLMVAVLQRVQRKPANPQCVARTYNAGCPAVSVWSGIWYLYQMNAIPDPFCRIALSSSASNVVCKCTAGANESSTP